MAAPTSLSPSKAPQTKAPRRLQIGLQVVPLVVQVAVIEVGPGFENAYAYPRNLFETLGYFIQTEAANQDTHQPRADTWAIQSLRL